MSGRESLAIQAGSLVSEKTSSAEREREREIHIRSLSLSGIQHWNNLEINQWVNWQEINKYPCLSHLSCKNVKHSLVAKMRICCFCLGYILTNIRFSTVGHLGVSEYLLPICNLLYVLLRDWLPESRRELWELLMYLLLLNVDSQRILKTIGCVLRN